MCLLTLKNAILRIKDYIQYRYEQKPDGKSEKLASDVNVLIDAYNWLEKREVEYQEAEELRDLLMEGVLDCSMRVKVSDAVCVPARYYIDRIRKCYLDVMPVSKRFEYAAIDWYLLQDSRKYLETMREILNNLPGNASEEEKQNIKNEIEDIKKYIAELT